MAVRGLSCEPHICGFSPPITRLMSILSAIAGLQR